MIQSQTPLIVGYNGVKLLIDNQVSTLKFQVKKYIIRTSSYCLLSSTSTPTSKSEI